MSSFAYCAEPIRNETWKNYSRLRGRALIDLVSLCILDVFKSRTGQGKVQQKLGQIVRRCFAQGRSHLLFSGAFIWAPRARTALSMEKKYRDNYLLDR